MDRPPCRRDIADRWCDIKGRTRNVTRRECMFRIFVGTSLVIVALSLVSVELTFNTILGALAMAAVSLYLLVTALTGFCPLYPAFGVPSVPRR